MATIRQIIQRVCSSKPNPFKDEMLLRWISVLDGKIAVQVLLLDIAEAKRLEYEYEKDMDSVPLVDFPYDALYDLWLAAQIDFNNGEYNKYQNTMEMFNAQYEEYLTYIAETYDPVQQGGCCVARENRYYLTAYGLAVKRGFVGTEDQWLESLIGPKGEQGIQGMSAYEVALENGYEGTEEEWLDSLRGPKGEQGIQGISAYEVALENGYEGTEAEWLESLVGPKGEQGDPGVSPVIAVTDITDGHRVTVTDAQGVKSFDVPNSQLPEAQLLRIDALEKNGTAKISGTGSVDLAARAGSGITFVGKMKAVQSGEGDPTPDNIRSITVTETVNVSVADAGGVTQQSHSLALPAPCGTGYIDWARRKYVQTYGVFVLKGTEGFYHWINNAFRLNNLAIAQATGYYDTFKGICSHYVKTYHTNVYNGTKDMAICNLYNASAIAISDSRFGTDAAAFNAYLAEQYEAGTPVTIIYPLATPVEYDLGALPTLTAQEGTTLLACDTNDGFTVQYNHDELALANWETLRDRVDYVIAEGVSGDWTYRKWNSGIAECWCKNAFSGAVTTAYGNTYYDSTAKNVAFPFTFLEAPHLVVNVVATDAQIYTSHIIVCNETLFNYYICSDKQQTNAKLNIHAHAVGRWK